MSKATIDNLSKSQTIIQKKQSKAKQSKTKQIIRKTATSESHFVTHTPHLPENGNYLHTLTHTNTHTNNGDGREYACTFHLLYVDVVQAVVALLMRKCRFNGGCKPVHLLSTICIVHGASRASSLICISLHNNGLKTR